MAAKGKIKPKLSSNAKQRAPLTEEGRVKKRAIAADNALPLVTVMQGLGSEVAVGVSITFLAEVFGHTAVKTKSLMYGCPIKAYAKNGKKKYPLYDLRVAATYVSDRKDPAQLLRFIEGLGKDDIPKSISVGYWDAKLKRQKWEKEAGELWRTEKVREVLGEVFQTIKFTTQLWAETLERNVEISEPQRKMVEELSDGLLQEIYEMLCKNQELAATGSVLSEMPDMLGDEYFDEKMSEEANDLL